jgi:hypothetical protein
MLSSIHPLGERARSNRWWVTVTAFTMAAMAAGAALGAAASAVGGAVITAPLSPVWPVMVLVAAGVADLFGVPVPWFHRQVNERWIGTYRGWVYGAGFGAQLGVGLSTFVVTWAVPALIIVLGMVGDVFTGIIAGVAFGFGRSIPLLTAGWIDRPSRLGRFHSSMAALGRPAHLTAAVSLLSLAAVGWVSA